MFYERFRWMYNSDSTRFSCRRMTRRPLRFIWMDSNLPDWWDLQKVSDKKLMDFKQRSNPR